VFRVYIEELELYAYHGMSVEEQFVGHRYVVSVSMSVNGNADETDALDGTVDYGAAAALVVEVATSSKYNTLERLGHVVAANLLERFTSIEDVELKIGKRLPPAPIIASEAGVRVTLRRPRN